MKRALIFVAILSTIVALPLARAAEGDLLDVRATQDATIKLIFDTDIGGDIDDAFALALIHRLADRGVCEALGITLTNSLPAAAEFVAAQNAVFGRPDIPVGLPRSAEGDGDSYPSAMLARRLADGSAEYPVPSGFEPEEPIALLRRLLASAPDASVVVVQVGFSTNLAALLDSPGDDCSPLTGKELAARKVRLLSVMGGAFALDPTAEEYRGHRESNVRFDVESARKLAREWPTPIVYCGYEVGSRIRTLPVNLKRDYRSRKARFLRDAFAQWASLNAPQEGLDHRRPTWDLESVLFVLRPEEGRGYFSLSEPGNVDFSDEGVTLFTPTESGTRRAFIVDELARARVGEAIANLCSEP